MNVTRVLQSTDATIRQTFYSAGTPTDVGAVTVTITRLDGSTVATGASTTNNADGTYDYALGDADTATLDRLRFDWLATTSNQTLRSFVEVVGAHLVNEDDIRSHDSAFANATKYPDRVLLAARDRVTDLLENWTYRSWVPRARFGQWAGPGGRRLYVGDARVTAGGSSGQGQRRNLNELISATIDGNAVTVADVTVGLDSFVHETGLWTAATISNPLNVTALWSYGYESVVDGADEIALMVIRDRLTRGPVSQYALSAATEYGTQRFIQPGGPMNNPTRIGDVNAWVVEHRVVNPLVH